jgi:hypothetical protein
MPVFAGVLQRGDDRNRTGVHGSAGRAPFARVDRVKPRRRPGDLLGVDEDAAGTEHGERAPEQVALVVVLEMMDRER